MKGPVSQETGLGTSGTLWHKKGKWQIGKGSPIGKRSSRETPHVRGVGGRGRNKAAICQRSSCTFLLSPDCSQILKPHRSRLFLSAISEWHGVPELKQKPFCLAP